MVRAGHTTWPVRALVRAASSTVVTRSDSTYDVVHVWRGRFYRLDGQPVGTGVPGPLTMQLRDRYWASHEDPRYSTPVRYDEPG